MVFISKIIFEKGSNVVRYIDCDCYHEKLAMVDAQNQILIFFVHSFNEYFSQYRKRFAETKQFSQKGLIFPMKIAQIIEKSKAFISTLKFSSQQFFIKNIEIINKEEINDDFEHNKENIQLKSFKSQQGKKINLMQILKDNKTKLKKDFKTFILAVGLENGQVIIFIMNKIRFKGGNIEENYENFNKLENYTEEWSEKFFLSNKCCIAVTKLEWSSDSNFLFVLHYNQEICVWGMNKDEMNNLNNPKLIHKICLSSCFVKSINANNQNPNSFFVLSNENIYKINFSNTNYESINFFEENNYSQPLQNPENNLLLSEKKIELTEKNDNDDMTQYVENDYMHTAVFNMTGELFLLSYHERTEVNKKEGVFLYEFDETKEKIIQKICLMEYKNNISKIACLCKSNFFFNKFRKSEIKTQKKNYVNSYYSVIAAIKENNLLLWKFCEFPKKNAKRTVKQILEITDFKYFLNFCLWIDVFTLILIDENGKMWYIKFNYLEMGLPLKINS